MQHNVLTKLDAELQGIRVVEEVTVAGHKFGFKSLTRHEASMAKALMPEISENMLQAFADSFIPQVSIALMHIDGVAVEEIWPLPDERPESPKRWRAEQVLKWLQGMPDTFVGELWTRFADLKEGHRQRLDALNTALTAEGNDSP